MVIIENCLTYWGRLIHICVGKLTTISSDSGLSPGRRQAIIWTNAGILLIGPLGTNFSGILIEIYTFSFKKMHLKMLSGKRRPFFVGFSVLIMLFFLHSWVLQFARKRKWNWKYSMPVAFLFLSIVCQKQSWSAEHAPRTTWLLPWAPRAILSSAHRGSMRYPDQVSPELSDLVIENLVW